MSQWAQALGKIKDLSSGRASSRAPVAASVPAQKTILNPQQQALVDCPHPRVRVTALAGTGKTTALVEYARRRNCKNPLYLAFNRTMARQAQQDFGQRVRCKTVHSLAWASYGKPLEHKIGLNHDLERLMADLDLPPTDLGLAFMDVLLASLDRFVKSDHPRPCRDDVAPRPWAAIRKMDVQGSLPDIDDAVSMILLLWARAQDPADLAVAASHDVAIKKAQLAGATIASELIMVDEAQDLTPAMASWIRSHHAGILVFAGDPYQELYSWRQPKPLEWGVPGEHDMALTHSHRFGPEVEPLVNPVLAALGSAHEIRAVGSSTRIIVDAAPTGRHHVLARTRARLLQHAHQEMSRGTLVAWPGASLDESVSADAWARLADKHGREDWMVEQSALSPPGLVNEDRAQVVLSTIHQAKGQTYGSVRVLDDVFDRDNAMDRQELCVRYVALTRATSQLALPGCAMDFRAPAPPRPPDDISSDGFD